MKKYKFLDDDYFILLGLMGCKIKDEKFLKQKEIIYGLKKGLIEECEFKRNEEECEKIFYEKIKELNGDWIPDWENHEQNKYRVVYNFKGKYLNKDENCYIKVTSNKNYLKSAEKVITLIDWLNENENEDVFYWFIGE